MTRAKGNTNARLKVENTTAAPWEKWPDTTLIERAQRFIETYCIPSKGFNHGSPLVLAQWQMDWLEAVLVEGITSSALTLPRGQGKSTFAGAVATWALFDPAVGDAYGGMPSIPVIATKLKQAREGVYGAAVAFRKNHDDLGGRSVLYRSISDPHIEVPFNLDGTIFPIAADPEGLQGLDPMLALVDEVGFVSIDSWNALLQASGKRPRSLVLALGTKSPEESPNALDHLLAQVKQYGNVPGFVMVEYSADEDADISDRKQWTKANPALQEGYLQVAAIEQDFLLVPEPAFRTFRLNLKTGSQTGWLGSNGPALWDHSTEEFDLDPHAVTFIGVDKSAYGDCSAVVAMQRDLKDRWLVIAKTFFPEGGAIDHKAVREHLRALNVNLTVAAIAYDSRYFVEGAQELEEEGLPMIEIPQTPSRMVAAFSSLYEDFANGVLIHNEDPTFRQHCLSAVPKMDSSGGFMLSKGKSKLKIDAAVAMGIARAASLSIEMTEAPSDDAFLIH